MEVIAGEDRLEATVKQHNAQFKLHYAEVGRAGAASFSTRPQKQDMAV